MNNLNDKLVKIYDTLFNIKLNTQQTTIGPQFSQQYISQAFYFSKLSDIIKPILFSFWPKKFF
jgi:hypothetical protein